MAVSSTLRAACEPAAVDKSTPPEELKTEAENPTACPVAAAPVAPPITIPVLLFVDKVICAVLCVSAVVVRPAAAVTVRVPEEPVKPVPAPPALATKVVIALPFAEVRLTLLVPSDAALTPVR